jgi:hypothetical protein
VQWYNVDHRHSGIRYVSPAQRHAGEDQAILAARHALYTEARERNPARWSGNTRNWSPIGAVTLNPERDSVVASCSEYALSCYAPTKNSNGLFFSGFRKDAWAKYTKPPKKTRESKVNRDRFKNDELPPENRDYRIKNEPSARIKSVHQESESTTLQLRTSGLTAFPPSKKVLKRERNRRRPIFAHPLLIKRQVTADRWILLQTPCGVDANRLVSRRATA